MNVDIDPQLLSTSIRLGQGQDPDDTEPWEEDDVYDEDEEE